MSAQKTTTQAEVDAILLSEYGLEPTGEHTKDKTQQLYKNQIGRGYMLPASNEGYSWYSVSYMLEYVKEMIDHTPPISIHNYTAKPELKLVESE
jgi:chromosome segregation and condensation protein ScpB